MISRDELIDKLMILNEQLWEGRVNYPRIERWLANFTGLTTDESTERDYALLLLSHVMYFAERELRELLRALYRDHYRYRLIQEIRRRNGRNAPLSVIYEEYDVELKRTRFLPLGNPSESSAHLLYWFRQENELPKDLFAHPAQLVDRPLTQPGAQFLEPNIQRLVFFDDFCGSGSQGVELAGDLLRLLRRIAARSGLTLECGYLVVVAYTEGIARVRDETSFDWVEAVYELDETYRVFSEDARQFADVPTTIDRAAVREFAGAYGKRLFANDPLGFEDGQLLLAFHHNTPDNSLPILWAGPPQHPQWRGIFRRFVKNYDNG